MLEINDQIVYRKDILLREAETLKLVNDKGLEEKANGLFSDPDSIHNDQVLEFSISSKSRENWSNEIAGIAK